MKIRARLLEMAAEEILQLIPASEYERIKREDPHPTFRAYVVGHEGTSTGKVITSMGSLGNVVKKWYRSAVEKIHDKIKIGMNFFHGHNYDNATDGRMSIGEVVGKSLKTIQDRLSVIAIAYIKPAFKNLPLDVASIEANIQLSREGDEVVADVEDISGIALGNSNTETPGFAHAGLLAQVQEFAEKSNRRFKLLKGRCFEMGDKTITLDDLKEIIKTEKLTPTDLFSLGEITEVPDVKDLIEEEKKESRKGEFIHRKRVQNKFEEVEDEWKAEKKKLEEQLASLKPLAIQNQRDDLFTKAVEKRKLDERQVAFIKRNLGQFNPEDLDSLERDLDKFLDGQIDSYKELAKDVFKIDVPEKGDGEGKPGLGPGSADDGDLSKFIPGVD